MHMSNPNRSPNGVWLKDVVLPLNRPAQTSRTWRKRRAKSAAGLDAVYGQFPSAKSLTGLVQKVPAHFLFTFKVTCDITLKCFVNLLASASRLGSPTTISFTRTVRKRLPQACVNPFARTSGADVRVEPVLLR